MNDAILAKLNPISKKEIGNQAEINACTFLEKQGLILIAKNYTTRAGELDLIMQDGKTLVFIEVRKRSNISHGNALESVTPAKIKKIIKTATLYLQAQHLLYKVPIRFDIIALHPVKGEMRLEWYQNAFTAD